MVDGNQCSHHCAYNTWDVAVVKSWDAQCEPEHGHIQLLITQACRKQSM
jgi:hypothetical protein